MTDEEYHLFWRKQYEEMAGQPVPRPRIVKCEGHWCVQQNHEHWMLMTHYPELYAGAIDRANRAFEFASCLASKEMQSDA